ncbi:hypothetical protein TEA_007244 [Camellia sinensis var. sinensis]|uniref:NB-ARC domain-containing protein n=1 Tax=Camellia sinensis var. sinensis TaxID=542762 RepID=A0A4S4EH81_CAMSN|nr:hypothetical protein TEA_007244 [Camellia sinensis var. sinensis]
MAADYLQFLKNKFISDYEEAVAEYNDFPFRSRFHEILEELQEMRISSSTPIRMKNLLYDLKFVLAECVMLAGKEKERITQTSKSLVGYQYVKKKWILFLTKRKLLSIKEKLLDYLHAVSGDVAAETERHVSLSLVRVRQQGDFPDFDETLIHGFEHHFEKIKDLLLKTPDTDSISTIGIVGMGGSGKTTLAQMVFNSPQVQGSFSPILWVELPQSLIKPHLIVFALLKSLASDFSWCGSAFDLNELLHNLHCYLLNKKYLIVMDNVWHASDWYFDLDSNSKLQMEGNENYTHLSHGLPRGSGGAIIVTSRLKEVASKMVGKRNLYPLEPTLDTESCWSIVLDSIEKEISDHWILEKIKDDTKFHLEFEKSVAPTSEVLKEIRSYPGASPTELSSVFDCAEVYYAKVASDHNNKVEAGGNCNPQDVVEALSKFSLGKITVNGNQVLGNCRTSPGICAKRSIRKLFTAVNRKVFLQFLKIKFINDFEEAEGEEFMESPLRLHFVEISEVLHQKRIDPWTPIGLKDPLYDLKFALADCVMLAGKERDRITKNKKSLLLSSHHYVKKQWFLFKMKRKLLCIKNELLQNMSDVDVADIADERLSSSSLIRVCQPTDFPDFNLTLIHGFNNHLRKMEALLLATTSDTDNFSAIGIVGMGGSGKTTLAQMVFHSSRVQESFSPMLWVELPQYPDLRSIKYLIVLDNMWPALSDDLDFNMYVTPLWNGFPRGSGGAIIVTSRLKEVASDMMFRLVFNKPVAPTSKLLKKLRTYSGVYYAEFVSDHNNEVEAGGSCDPEIVVEDLKKLFQAEITLKIDKNNTNKNRRRKKAYRKRIW